MAATASSSSMPPARLRDRAQRGARDRRTGMSITHAANEQLGFPHPENPDWSHISFCLFAAPLSSAADGVLTGRRGGDPPRQDRPVADRHGLLGADGRAARARTAWPRRTLRGLDHRLDLHRAASKDDADRRYPGNHPESPAAPGSPAPPSSCSTRPIPIPPAIASPTPGALDENRNDDRFPLSRPQPRRHHARSTPRAASTSTRLEDHLERYIAAGVDGFVLSAPAPACTSISRARSPTPSSRAARRSSPAAPG